jgi:hypothetical protein
MLFRIRWKGGITIDWREALLTKVFRIVKAMRLDRLFRLGISFSTYSFTDYFKGFEKVEVVRRIFGEKTEEVLRNLRVEFFPRIGYMGVNGSDGHLIVNPAYLKNGDRLEVYLDVIHELVHVRQRIEGRDLFDTNYSYAEMPTEVEAYRYAVEEARRLRLSDERICEYLKTPWMSIEDLRKLAKALNVRCKQ